MFRPLIAAVLISGMAPSFAQSLPIYNSLNELRKSGDYEDLFLIRLVSPLSRIDRVPQSDIYRWYYGCRAGNLKDCRSYIKYLQDAFNNTGSWGAKTSDWVPYTGPKINANQFEIYLVQNAGNGGTPVEVSRLNCILTLLQEPCSIYFNWLKTQFASEQKRYQANPFAQ